MSATLLAIGVFVVLFAAWLTIVATVSIIMGVESLTDRRWL